MKSSTKNLPFFVRGYWYPIAFSNEVEASLTKVNLIGENIYLRRCRKGELLAYAEPKTKALLCGTTPGQDHAERLLSQELYGLVWIFAGPDELASTSSLPAFPEFDEGESTEEESRWKVLSGKYLWSSAHYSTILENSMDPAHTTFVHQGFGSAKDPVIADLKLEKHDTWGSASISSYPPDNWRQKYIYRRKRSQVTVTYSFFMPNIFKLEVSADGFNITLFTFSTPRHWTETETFWYWLRSGSGWFKSSLLDPLMRKRMSITFAEDEAVVNTIVPKAVPLMQDDQIPLACDTLSCHYRRLLRKSLEEGQIVFQMF